MSIEFRWRPEDFNSLVESCERDTATPYILKYMPKDGVVLEAGCGLARYVEFLSRRGFNVVGVELSQDTVDAVRALVPHLDIRQGDVSELDFENDSISGIISLGVVEHFVIGPEKPLREMFRVLNPGAYAVVTVPSFNHIRKVKYRLDPINLVRIAKQSNTIRRILGKRPINMRTSRGRFVYRRGAVPYKHRRQLDQLQLEEFFEYVFSKQEFEVELREIGFTIVESVPIALMDGIYHDISKRIVPFRDWTFYPNSLAKALSAILGKISFCHNHMHLCVVRK